LALNVATATFTYGASSGRLANNNIFFTKSGLGTQLLTGTNA